MSVNTHATCPVCEGDCSVQLEYEGGDIVPYGSTTARTPGGFVAVGFEDCPEGHLEAMDEKERDKFLDRVAENYEPDYDGPDEEDYDD